MQQEIQKDEIGADLALHQGFQIEIDVGWRVRLMLSRKIRSRWPLETTPQR